MRNEINIVLETYAQLYFDMKNYDMLYNVIDLRQ